MFSHKGFALPRDLSLLMSVFFLLIYYSILIRLLPIRKLIGLIERNRSGSGENAEPGHPAEETRGKIYRAANFFLKRVWNSERSCLRRTLLLYRWCCHLGIPSRVMIGVSKEEGNLQSHAWLEVAGLPYKESSEHLSTYTPMLEG
ncbi:MAG: lasso peptide biosynthesis B2 protein [Clostridia bacterium]|nr:lasso peptide biosynthesis B2 protein [Clostridia bacterium]